ncbi:MAG: ABC transporter permease [Planctomycetia bacterium]|jgi:oligopeptide transport system permease protein|nr:ABC transporter permease [Planctomycetia bacterium]
MNASQPEPAAPMRSSPDGLVAGSSLWQDAWRRLRKNKMAVASGVVIAVLGLACLLGPTLLAVAGGYDPDAQDLAYGPQPPSWQHPFGTDFYGRDLLVRVLAGGQVSLAVGILAALIAALIGTIYGAVSSYAGGLVDSLLMRVVDILYALPYMFLVIILVTILGQSLVLLFVALGAVGWLLTARVVRGQVMSLKEQDFVLAARSLGTSGRDIVFRHLIPNTLGPVIVTFTLTVPSMILQEAFLSFLGLGVQPPHPSLGSLINDGANQMLVFWWTLVFPGGVMAVLLFALNFLGDGVRDALDPRMRT